MTQQEILNSRLNKTQKMRLLFELGLTKTQASELVGVNYGFAYNVWKAWAEGRSTTSRRLQTFNFDTVEFGVEIEAFGLKRNEIITELTAAGIEVRGEDYNHSTRTWWKIVSDSSIHGEDAFELVSPVLKGTTGLQNLRTTLLIISGLEAKVNKTCGLHIHINAREFTSQTWINLFKNYQTIESLIDTWMAPSRRENHNTYCKTLRGIDLEDISKQSVERTTREISNRFFSDRYFKVNIQSFWRHGSVEFRQHAGTTNHKKVTNWILFLARLVEFSKNETLTEGTFQEAKRFLNEDLITYFKQRQQEMNS